LRLSHAAAQQSRATYITALKRIGVEARTNMPMYTLHGPLTATKALKAELVAAFAGIELHRPPFTWGLSSRTPRFLAMSPSGKVHNAHRAPLASVLATLGFIGIQYCPSRGTSAVESDATTHTRQAVAQVGHQRHMQETVRVDATSVFAHIPSVIWLLAPVNILVKQKSHHSGGAGTRAGDPAGAAAGKQRHLPLPGRGHTIVCAAAAPGRHDACAY